MRGLGRVDRQRHGRRWARRLDRVTRSVATSSKLTRSSLVMNIVRRGAREPESLRGRQHFPLGERALLVGTDPELENQDAEVLVHPRLFVRVLAPSVIG